MFVVLSFLLVEYNGLCGCFICGWFIFFVSFVSF